MTARVLVVDDLVPNVKLLEAKLTSEYFEVLTANDGPGALAIIEDTLPDIVLLDVMMPGMDGFEVCERIKADVKMRHIPVVMVTALSDSADRIRGLEAGADDFLTKPVNDIALFARVRSLVRLKMLMDEWRLREQTSGEFGLLSDVEEIEALDFRDARVLVVEDSAIEAKKLAQTLPELFETVELVPSIEAGHRSAMATDFDVVVISLRLKNQDALRLCSTLRSSDQTRHTPILLLVEESDTERLAKAMEIGVNDYLVRPIDRNELKARLRTQIRRRRYQKRMRDTYERSLELALTDELTGLYNRRYIEAHIRGLIGRLAESGRDVSIMMFDIDHFKRVNDTYGHAVGDAVLRQIARRVTHNVRSFDTVARYGGEEFVVVMPETELSVAAAVAERLRMDLASTSMEVEAGAMPITISVGVSAVQGKSDTTAALLRRADEALYEGKRLGRNKVVVWTEEGLTGVWEVPDPARASK